MRRRESLNEVRVFKFGARPGVRDNETTALDQLWLMSKYRNVLVAIDHKSREGYRSIVEVGNPSLDRIKANNLGIKELRKAIKAKRTGRRREEWKALDIPEVAEVKALAKENKGLRPEADRVKALNRKVYEPEIRKLKAEFLAEVKSVRGRFANGTYADEYTDLHGKRLFWMNEESICNNFLKDRDAAMKAATALRCQPYRGEGIIACRPRASVAKDPRRDITVITKDGDGKAHSTPMPADGAISFLAAHPEATVARADRLRIAKLIAGEMGDVQKCQGSITAEQAFDPSIGSPFFLTVEDAPRLVEGHAGGKGGTPKSPDPLSRRQARIAHATAHILVGTNPKTYFTLPVVLHRPFPEGSAIKGVAAKREKIGGCYRWSLLVTVDFPKPAPACGTGTVALDPGWASETLEGADGRIRVGGLTDEDGRLGGLFPESSPKDNPKFAELALDAKFLSETKQAERLQGLISKATDEVMLHVNRWLGGNKEESAVRSHLQKASTARQAPSHLVNAVWSVRNGGKLDDIALRMMLEGWHKTYRHLDTWLSNLRDQLNARKLHEYRQFAARAAKAYRTLVVDDADLRKAAEAPEAEKLKKQPQGGQRQKAAPSLLVKAFVEAFGKAGGKVWYVANRTSATCSECGHINPKLGASRRFICEACGYGADREFNSGRNLIGFHKAGLSSQTRQSTRIRKPPAIPDGQGACVNPADGGSASPLEPLPF